MIEDFTNPHGEVKPTKVVTIKQKVQEFRIVRIHGMYHVEYLKLTLKPGKYQSINRDWITCQLYGTDKPAVFQTLPEAEHYMQRRKSDTIEYYY